MSQQSKQLMILVPILAFVLFLLWRQGPVNWWIVALFGAGFIAKVLWAWHRRTALDAKAETQEPSN